MAAMIVARPPEEWPMTRGLWSSIASTIGGKVLAGVFETVALVGRVGIAVAALVERQDAR